MHTYWRRRFWNLLCTETMNNCPKTWRDGQVLGLVCLFGWCWTCSCCVLLYSSGHRCSPSPFMSHKQQRNTPNVRDESEIIVYVVGSDADQSAAGWFVSSPSWSCSWWPDTVRGPELHGVSVPCNKVTGSHLVTLFGGFSWKAGDSALLRQNIHRTGLSGWPPQLAALMDSFATSQSFLHTVFSPVLSQMSARLASADSVAPSPPGRKQRRRVWIEQSKDTCWWWAGTWEPRPLRSSENRRIDRLKRLSSETHLCSPETDWPLPPWVTHIPDNPRVGYLFA